jgi:hypothetical protein
VVLVPPSGAKALEFEHVAARLEPCPSEQAMNSVARRLAMASRLAGVKAQNPYHL